jgi:hypothetical protein
LREAYLSDQQPTSLDYQKWIYEIHRSDAIRAHENEDKFSEQTNEAAISTGNLTLRMAMLINGGAAVALLAFIGGLLSKDKGTYGHVSEIAASLMWFGWGVLLSVAGIGAVLKTRLAQSKMRLAKLKTRLIFCRMLID